jgi:predicted DsbA family dithiol-disulfide isomerase
MKIDFVSDVACPWCAIGLNALEQALARIGDELPVTLAFQPFELNPKMAPEGEDAGEHLSRKYGMDAAQLQAARERVRARGAEVGFAFGERARVWNTFDAHRLLHWAGAEGPQGAQRSLKHRLLEAYHGRGLNPSDPAVLLEAAVAAGLPEARAREVIGSDAFADDVRRAERHWQQLGISAVPSVVVNDRHLIQGGQPPEVFEQALRQIAAGA